MMEDLEQLKLKNQLCFPLYACAKEVVRRYRPFLDELDLTYTQYIVMLVLWEENEKSVHDLGERLFLDSGTLTPVLKSLEAKGYLTRRRSKADERVLLVALTDEGQALKESAAEIPKKMSACVALEPQEAATLYSLLYKMLGQF
ncbi:MAG: MarR family transcriptional regulator [Clostridia bacterium]|nr:MarR family transcriptional regulator [Clostridia bacterium]